MRYNQIAMLNKVDEMISQESLTEDADVIFVVDNTRTGVYIDQILIMESTNPISAWELTVFLLGRKIRSVSKVLIPVTFRREWDPEYGSFPPDLANLPADSLSNAWQEDDHGSWGKVDLRAAVDHVAE